MARSRVQPIYIPTPITSKVITSVGGAIIQSADQINPLPTVPNTDTWYSANSTSYISLASGATINLVVIVKSSSNYIILYSRILANANINIVMPPYSSMLVCCLSNGSELIPFNTSGGPEFGVYAYTVQGVNVNYQLSTADADVVMYPSTGYSFRDF